MIFSTLFTAPVDGVYFFQAKGKVSNSPQSVITLYYNEKPESYAISRNDGDDTFSTTAQFKMLKGDTVYVEFSGYFFMPAAVGNTVFEGHLISKLTGL